jgi:hypothetical protein
MEQESIVTIEAIPNPPPCYRECLRVLSDGVEIGVVVLNSHPLSLRSRSKSPFAGWHGHSDHNAEIPGLHVSADVVPSSVELRWRPVITRRR